MILFPNAKINLGLHICEKRPDGFHNLETVFYPLPWCDVLEIVPAKELVFRSEGLPIDGNPDNNLCLQAYRLLQTQYDLPPVHIFLIKHLPMGAGLGGGSADAAFVLCALNHIFKLQLGEEQLQQAAARIGSDCAFFIRNTPALATGKGEQLSPLSLDLSRYRFVCVFPNIAVNTAWAYRQITPKMPAIALQHLISQPITTWKEALHNDFQAPISRHFPDIAEGIDFLYRHQAVYAAMSGSGSAFYGIFEPHTDLSSLQKWLSNSKGQYKFYIQ